jgi:glucokinase
MIRLIADIGGTNVRFALARRDDISDIKVFACNDYATPADAAQAYLSGVKGKPETGAFAIASPLDGSDKVEMTNHIWAFSIDATRKALGLKSLRIVNDFAALAYAVPHLGLKDCVQVGEGRAQKNMPVGIIGPGTGLGVASVVFDEDGRPVTVAGEGGHVTMAASDAREFALFEYLKKQKYSHISAERVISGKGLVNIYDAIRGVDGLDLPEREPAAITAAALKNECAACSEALSLMCHFLGVVAGNLALTAGAFGGIYIAGGIVPQLGDYFARSRFRESFMSKGRYRDYLGRIPTSVITHPYPGLEGLRHVG